MMIIIVMNPVPTHRVIVLTVRSCPKPQRDVVAQHLVRRPNVYSVLYVDTIGGRYGAVALLCLIGIFVYLLYSKPQVYWGGVSQALLYHQVRKCLLMLDERKEHAKVRTFLCLSTPG